jgi:DNA polymerase III epsilon subunit-like protein
MADEMLVTLNKCNNLMAFIRKLKKPLIMFDFETGSLGHYAEPVQLSGIKVDPITGEAKSFNAKFNTRGQIDPRASAVHGLTKSILKNESYFDERAKKIKDFFEGSHLMAYNYNFDVNILVNSLKRANIKFVPAGYIICPLAIEKEKIKTQTKLKVSNKLGEVHKRHITEAIDETKLHEASYDVCCMMRVFDSQLVTFKLSESIEKIGKKYKNKIL